MFLLYMDCSKKISHNTKNVTPASQSEVFGLCDKVHACFNTSDESDENGWKRGKILSKTVGQKTNFYLSACGLP